MNYFPKLCYRGALFLISSFLEASMVRIIY